MEQKYGALRILSSVNAFVGYVILVIGGISSLVMIFSIKGGFLAGLPLLLACVFFGITLIAFGELIHVFIDIESNTRNAAVQNSSNSNLPIGIKGTSNPSNESPSSVKNSSDKISEEDELISINAINKLEKYDYTVVAFDPNLIKWTLKSNTNGESFELNLKELIDLAKQF